MAVQRSSSITQQSSRKDRQSKPLRRDRRRTLITGVRHEAALLLRQAGWSDAQLAGTLCVTNQTIQKWRKEHGIPRLPSPACSIKIDEARALALYHSGVDDVRIAKELGVCQSGVCRWRQRRNLPPNNPNPSRLTTAERRRAKVLLRNGASRRQVADALGRKSLKFAQKLRGQMKGEAGLRKTGATVRHQQRRAMRSDPRTLLERIRRAVGRSHSPDITDDAVNELYLAVLDGHLSVDQIEREAPRYISRVYNQFASKFTSVNIDERDENGLCFGDVLIDETALEAVEMAGALALAGA